MDNLKARQDLYNGFGDTLAKGFELAVTPVLFGGLGWFLDRVIGITPILTVLFTVVCLIGLGTKMYYGYAAAMAEQEKDAPWARGRRSPGRPDDGAE